MGIDLNTVEDEPAAAAAGAVCCRELWHACAGGGVALPRRGSAVVYLPQAHLAAGGCDGAEVLAAPRVPPYVVCRVVDVELRADAATDEVYARLALVAEDKVKARRKGRTAWWRRVHFRPYEGCSTFGLYGQEASKGISSSEDDDGTQTRWLGDERTKTVQLRAPAGIGATKFEGYL